MNDDDIVDVKIKKSEISLVVWFVPFVALIVGGWMIYQYYSKIGPMITITFKNSGGLSPKQSVVKFRDVKVGKVERVEILKEEEGVKVYARINKDVKPFLNEHAKFWIVKPEINLGKVRGLDALMNGSYIQLSSHLGGVEKFEFKGYKESPLSFNEEKGKTYKLIADKSYNLNAGTPVYYKQMQVGQVKRVNISKDAKKVEIYVFVKDEYSKYININTKFWNLRNFTINLTDSGLNIESGSISQLLMGGVEFDTKDFQNSKKTSDTFYLYSSKDEALQKKIGSGNAKYVDFILRFDEGVGFLNIGASVRMDGFIVGKVKDIVSTYDTKHLKIKSLVIVRIDISTFASGTKPPFMGLKEAVQNGLCARLEQVNPLVNYMYINLIKDDKKNILVKSGRYYVFPTKKAKLSDITSKIKSFMGKLEKLPIKDAVKNFSDSFASLKNLSDDINVIVKDKDTKALPKNISKSLQKLNNSFDEFSKLSKSYQGDSKFSDELGQTLKDIDKASKELHKVLTKVKRKPNSLIFGE